MTMTIADSNRKRIRQCRDLFNLQYSWCKNIRI